MDWLDSTTPFCHILPPARFEFKRRCDLHRNATEVDLVRDALRLSPHLLRGQRRQRVQYQQLQVSRESEKQQRQPEKVEKAAAKTLKARI